MDENERNEIHSWIEESMQAENLSDMKIELVNTNSEEHGLAAVLVFAKVRGTDKANNQKEIDLVIKMGKRGKEFREKQPIMRECYKRELFFYERVIPTFHEFQLDRNILKTFSTVPKCYKTFLSDDMEVVVLENLKTRGFVPHDVLIPLNLAHIKLVLESYARIHALSFALRDQKEEKFSALTADLSSLMKQMTLTTGLLSKNDRGLENLKKAGRADLVAQYERVINRSKEEIMLEIFDDIPQEAVITHGDCHVGNLLFKYKDDDYEKPENVAIIDWQFCELHSPVMDLSYCMYAGMSKEDMPSIGELLIFYHGNLARFLKDLGSDVENLFPYKTLIEHWKKYSIYGFIFVTTFMELYYVDRENNSSFDDFQNNGDMGELLYSTKLKKEDSYRERLAAIVEHFCNFKLT